MTDDRPPNADEAPDEQAITAVTIEQLSARIDELMQRVQAGEVFGIYRAGALEAILQPPDPAERKMNELVQAGMLQPGWPERQQQLRERLGRAPFLHSEPESSSLTEVLLRMREEETR